MLLKRWKMSLENLRKMMVAIDEDDDDRDDDDRDDDDYNEPVAIKGEPVNNQNYHHSQIQVIDKPESSAVVVPTPEQQHKSRLNDSTFRKMTMEQSTGEAATMKQVAELMNEQNLSQESELGGLIRAVNEDKMDEGGYSSIDMKTRITDFEASCMAVNDYLNVCGCLPRICTVTRTKKRLNVSLKGMGRSEIVQMIQNERNKQTNTGFMQRAKDLFMPQQQQK